MELPPAAQVMNLSLGVWSTQVVYALAKLGICDLLAERPRTVTELASQLGAVPSRLARLLRAATGFGIVSTVGDETYALGPLGQPLRTDAPDSVRYFAIMNGEEHYQYWGHLLDAVRSEGVLFDQLYGQDYWSYNAANPEAGEIFNRAMADLARNVHSPAVAQFDFSPYSTVMDVGGGTGTMLSGVLRANPHLRGILLDLPDAVDQATEVLTAAGVADRAERVAGNYLQEVPAGADVYMVSLIFQDLDDDKALPLLQNVRRAMRSESVFVAVELVVPDGDAFHLAKLNDLNVLMLLGGRIRTAQEFGELYAKAGLGLRAVVPSPGPMSLVVGEPA
jgi:ubiquinone/menaquinone biosynthesis C-methylase UbiE